MTVQDDLALAGSQAAALRQSVSALSGRLGDTIDVRRLKDDVARVVADLNLIAQGSGATPSRGQPGEIVYIPDEDYDPSFWSEAEDEGVGPRREG
jgi:hypothetical protein